VVVASRVYCMDVCVDVVRCEDVSWRGKGGVQSICMYVCMYGCVCVCVMALLLYLLTSLIVNLEFPFEFEFEFGM
jgi:hypothetical protein